MVTKKQSKWNYSVVVYRHWYHFWGCLCCTKEPVSGFFGQSDPGLRAASRWDGEWKRYYHTPR
jgi:hypothetical protein